mgnify:CR=1 FL=1
MSKYAQKFSYLKVNLLGLILVYVGRNMLNIFKNIYFGLSSHEIPIESGEIKLGIYHALPQKTLYYITYKVWIYCPMLPSRFLNWTNKLNLQTFQNLFNMLQQLSYFLAARTVAFCCSNN